MSEGVIHLPVPGDASDELRAEALLHRNAGPVLVRQVELAAGSIEVTVPQRQLGLGYEALHLLVRLHRRPLGVAVVKLDGSEVSERRLTAAIWKQLGAAIVKHVVDDGFTPPLGLPLGEHLDTARAPCRHEVAVRGDALPTVSVVVPTCNRPETLVPCVGAVLASSYAPHEVIVVDNRPRQSTTREALRAHFGMEARVRYVDEPRPGTSRARNRGLDVAKGDLVAFIDDDVLVDRHWLAHTVLAFIEHPEASCVTGLILPLELETPAQRWIEQYGGFSKGFERIMFDSSRRGEDPLFPYTAGRFGSGANISVRTAHARELGGFDVALGCGTEASSGEDLDFFIRLMHRRRTLVYEPSALCWHRHRASVPDLRYQLLHYGRGLAAVYTKQLVEGPHRRDFVSRVPSGVRYLLARSSPKNARRQADYPKQLAMLELAGMMTGPRAYFTSRRQRRH